MDSEPVIRAKIEAKTGFGNAVAVVAATLLPGAVFGLPILRAMLLPHLRPLILLYVLHLL